MSRSNTHTPIFAALFFIAVGLLMGLIGLNVTGAIIAGIAVVPSFWGMWNGMQQNSQGALVWATLSLIAALGVAGLLTLRGVFDLFS